MLLTATGWVGEAQDSAKPPPSPSETQLDRASSRRPPANLNSYFSLDDYPIAAIRARHMGTTGFRLTIDTTGRVSNCEITASSGSQPLDETTCWALRTRARYTPARDADGAPATGHDSGRVTWRLPDDPADRAGLEMSYIPARALNPDVFLLTAADIPAGVRLQAPVTPSSLRLAVGREGRVIGCDIDEGSGTIALDAAACRLVAARARFEPGRNAAGATICDVTWAQVAWTTAGVRSSAPEARQEPAHRPPPLRDQLNADHCPGWIRPPR